MSNWYPLKPLVPQVRTIKKKQPQLVSLYNICPVCNGKGLVRRPIGFQDNKEVTWSPCAAGTPYHKSK